MLSFSTYHIDFFFQNSFSKFSKKYFFLNFHFFFSKFWKNVSKKKFYMISWKNKHFSLLTFFEIFDFWNNDYLILPIFWPKPSSDKSPLITSCSKWISWAYCRKKCLLRKCIWLSIKLLQLCKDELTPMPNAIRISWFWSLNCY